ncbi:LOW QUALITY PROTEIN: hypothetical protein ACHAW6_006960 [Cyclotella cf. meneghiniana]
MCRMVEPIKISGKCITMDSRFNASMGIVDMEHIQGVYGQALIKKRGCFLTKDVPRNWAHYSTLCLFINAEEGYVTKFTSTFRCPNRVEGLNAYLTLKDGTQVRWVYIEPNSHHNHAKHWVDDVNNCRHAPIDLADAWQTKCWPNWQFTFFIAVNAENSLACARGVEGDAGLDFQRNLVVQLLENNYDKELIHRSPIRAKNTRARASISAGEGIHAIMNQPYFTSKWLGST